MGQWDSTLSWMLKDDLDAYLSYKEMEEVLAGEGNVIRYDIDSI